MALKIKYNAPVVLTFALACVLAHGINLITFSEEGYGLFTRFFALPASFNFSDFFNYPALVLYSIAHGDVNHLMGNLAFILLLGPILEEKYGSRKMLYMMFLTALITAIANIFLFDTGLIGASGIVFMFIMLISFANFKQGEIPLSFILILILFVGKEVLKSFQENNISEFAHIIGGICGSLFGFSKKETPNVQTNRIDF